MEIAKRDFKIVTSTLADRSNSVTELEASMPSVKGASSERILHRGHVMPRL